MVLEGRNRSLLRDLKKEMGTAAEQLHFERAAEIRDQITALSKTLEKQIVASGHLRDLDVFGYCRQGTSVGIAILFVRDGLISGSRNFFLSDPLETNQSILAQALNQFYDQSTHPPKEIMLPFAINDADLLGERFSELVGSKVRLMVPRRGDRVQLLQMANANAAHIFDEKEKQVQAWQGLSDSMRKLLHLDHSPERIECLDISNTSGKQAVGSLVCFEKGSPAPAQFRHYKIISLP